MAPEFRAVFLQGGRKARMLEDTRVQFVREMSDVVRQDWRWSSESWRAFRQRRCRGLDSLMRRLKPPSTIEDPQAAGRRRRGARARCEPVPLPAR